MEIKDRIKTFKRIPASKLVPHPDNFREHPKGQADAMSAALYEIGYADALVVREHGDAFQILDGHLRAEISPDMKLPCLVVDLNDEEARKFIATHDPIGALAKTNATKLESLIKPVTFRDDDIQKVVDDLVRKNKPKEPKSSTSTSQSKMLHTCPDCGHQFTAAD